MILPVLRNLSRIILVEPETQHDVALTGLAPNLMFDMSGLSKMSQTKTESRLTHAVLHQFKSEGHYSIC
jgi:hypothetical protein